MEKESSTMHKNTYKKTPLKKWVWLSLILIGFGFGWFGHTEYYQYCCENKNLFTSVRVNSPEYRFTRPLLFTDNSKITYEKLDPLKDKIKKYVFEKQSQNKASNISFYYRDLTTGEWTGVNEDAHYEPSSMLKIMVLMVYLNLAQSDPNIVAKKLPYDGVYTKSQYYQPAQILLNGNYRVDELLKRLITESDNAANVALSTPIEKEILNLYSILELPPPPENREDFMSPEKFSALFRTLYGSTYIPAYLSEQALKLLSQTSFTKGLIAGIPDGVIVSHKFGEHTIFHTNQSIPTEHELHDCGIVYIPEKPYLICVMTKGNDFTNLEKVIGDISRTTYTFSTQR